MTEHRYMRASDADRAKIAERLRRATDEGRLLAGEFDDRLGAALDARTYGELDALIADLPRERHPAKRPGRLKAALRSRAALIGVPTAALATGMATVAILLAASGGTAGRAAPQARSGGAGIPGAVTVSSATTTVAAPRPVNVAHSSGSTTNAPAPSR